ncbi:hypothetical protein M514_05505 [Trichuris suis]|uniref:Uncharacterized protein n=1 Tax=Trichuris suis TaxID=68888 RepID=A0A085M8P3_9BILA|nr:hypothetical protein M513_05505 [Trichuris suis]KFD62811.1 hypothetical protein M514_05505 [Trichuris suis]
MPTDDETIESLTNMQIKPEGKEFEGYTCRFDDKALQCLEIALRRFEKQGEHDPKWLLCI